MLRRKLVIGVGALIFAAVGPAASAGADEIPDDVSQHSHNSYAVGGWHFDEPDGSTGITVQLSDEFTVAPQGLKFSANAVCVGMARESGEDEDEDFDFAWGCKELDKSEFDFDSRLDDAFVSTSVALECLTESRCSDLPNELRVELSWTGGDELVRSNGVSRNDECRIHRRDEYRPAMEVHGSLSDGVNEFTHGVAGAGAIQRYNRTALVVGDPTDCS